MTPDSAPGRATSAPFALPERPTKPDILAKYFRVLGDPTRLRILQLLADGELSVTALAERLDLAQPNVSNHLACLRWCRFVETRREHRTIYYQIVDSRVSQLVTLADQLLQNNLEHVAACRIIDHGD